MFQYQAEVIRVVDGDTIDALIDLGFSVWVKKRIRLHGIDAWESRTRDLQEKVKGVQAKDRLIDILNNCGGKFMLKSHGIGKFGRCLGEIYIDTSDTSINEMLVNEGHAVKYSGKR